LKKLKNKKDFLEDCGEKDALINFMLKIDACSTTIGKKERGKNTQASRSPA